jgi:hypothetical protein
LSPRSLSRMSISRWTHYLYPFLFAMVPYFPSQGKKGTVPRSSWEQLLTYPPEPPGNITHLILTCGAAIT